MKTIYEMTVQELLDAGFSVYASNLTQMGETEPLLTTDAQKMETLQALLPDGLVIRGWLRSATCQPSGGHATRRLPGGNRVEVSIS